MLLAFQTLISRAKCHCAKNVDLIGSGLATAVVLAFFIWLGWSGAGLREQMRLETERAVRVAELRGTIFYLNDWLIMSARVAALSGQAIWIERYNKAGPQLTTAIAEAVALATPEVAAELARTTDEASHDLIAMERASIARGASGDRTGAMAMLDSPEFEYLEASYASGMATFGEDSTRLAAMRIASLNKRAWRETSGLALAAVLLIGTIFAAIGYARLRSALKRTDMVARTDILTDLPNRRHLYEDLRAGVTRLKSDGSELALVLLDLDRFKLVNDLHGHAAGDQLLQLVSARLRGVARNSDLIARLGGDEFALILRSGGAADQRRSLHEAAALTAQRIITVLTQPFVLPGGTVVQITVSIGLALAWREGDDADAVVHRADVALYQAKADGCGRFRFFESAMDATSRARALLDSELRQAIAADLIIPNFQPKVDMNGGHLVGFEMLARWPHPTRGMISPAEFIPIAEEIGLIGPMTDRLIRHACRIATTWPPDISLACNISPLQLRDRGLPAMIRAALDDASFPAGRLELEITESALVGDLSLAREILRELKAMGVQLALDDFGTGYSSLRHLQMLPFDTLKIDASFVGAMVNDLESRKIVAAVVGLAQSLGLATVAEGIEETETSALLRSLGCDIGQGWLFGRPVSPEVAGMMITENRQSRMKSTLADCQTA